MTTPPQTASTPEPVLKAAAVWGSLATLLVTTVGVLVAVGVLTSEQAAALSTVVDYVSSNIVTVGTVVVGLVSLVSGLAGSFATAAVGRRHVSPVPQVTVVEATPVVNEAQA